MARKVRNFKASEEEWNRIKDKAASHTAGNVSAWIKKAAQEYEPPKETNEACPGPR